MTNEEAIKHLHDDWYEMFDHSVCVDYEDKDEFLEALGVAIIALRKENMLDRSKWNDCVHCTTKRSLEARLNLGYDYCEHCGRPLTEHAWKRLENRIRGDND